MSITNRLGSDTIGRLREASEHRMKEADYLADGGHRLASIYFYGHAVEILPGMSYFRSVLQFKLHQQIPKRRRNLVVEAARQMSSMEDRTHPIDGLAKLLVQDNAVHGPIAYPQPFADLVIANAGSIANNWGPRLRYRAIDIEESELTLVQSAATWYWAHRLDS